MKLVKRSYTITDVMNVVDRVADYETPKPVLIYKVASVEIRKVGGEKVINWQRGDIPVFRDGEVLVGKPKFAKNIEATVPELDVSARKPYFTSDNFCSVFHFLAYCKLTGSIRHLMQAKSREVLDRELANP